MKRKDKRVKLAPPQAKSKTTFVKNENESIFINSFQKVMDSNILFMERLTKSKLDRCSSMSASHTFNNG